MSAPYEAIINTTDDETFVFTIEPRKKDGSMPLWSDVTADYALKGNGVDMRLTVGNGITIDEVLGRITIGPVDRNYRLRPGQYRHGMTVTQPSSGITLQMFDGTVNVTEGNMP
jgi:hypothetical protein